MCSNNTVFHGYGPYNRSYSPRTPSVQLAVGVLQDLLQYSSQLPELAREVGLNSILGILTSLLGLKSEDKLGAYFLAKMDSANTKVQEVCLQLICDSPPGFGPM
ncbi:proline-, glutamic acid- and leucine-rich protein 1-like isoform X3 [Oncorhynchus tshawytscha]|uniref:Pre-rRNA-processing protein RIX1 N-terminal domain-containing protein n=1 Tax=Oncorhynchus tshawytscha TaxID=74940 RepID=A0AAZ3SXA7_ONCTS|nr:proline-, glutamic acid- and leucine-rich protein 1-like isoform X3 [Oncorhynchus tshawytscha]